MEECLICKAPLEYLVQDQMMECAICHKKELSKTRCVNGHYVCSSCHTQGMDSIFGLCLAERSTDPIAILDRMMALPFCHMHGPEHHVMVGAALLTAYKNAGGELDLPAALSEIHSRGMAVPGGACGFWGACGAGISAGQFVAIATQSTPLAREPWGLSNQMTARALECIGRVGGPRCCKRDSWLSILAAADFAREQLGVEMTPSAPRCEYSARNSQCIGSRCPFSPAAPRPRVAFLCVHNSCRSQMAEALGRQLGQGVFESYSAGTEPGPQINPDAVRLMQQVYGIDMTACQYNKPLSALPKVDIVITMGCNVQCPTLPCTYREDWGLEDPTGQGDPAFLSVMARIRTKGAGADPPHPAGRAAHPSITKNAARCFCCKAEAGRLLFWQGKRPYGITVPAFPAGYSDSAAYPGGRSRRCRSHPLRGRYSRLPGNILRFCRPVR